MAAAFLPGFGLVRRAMTLGLCAVSFWAGVQVERARHDEPASGPASARALCGAGTPGCGNQGIAP